MKALSPLRFVFGFILVCITILLFLLSIITTEAHTAPEYNLQYRNARSSCDTKVVGICIVLIDVTNPYNERVTADYANISGPGYVDFFATPRVHITDAAGKRCTSSLSYIDYAPGEHKVISVSCKPEGPTLKSPIRSITIDNSSYNVVQTNLTEEEIQAATAYSL